MIIHGTQESLFNNVESNSIDAIITDPPYGVLGKHKIETGFDFNLFLENSYRVLKKGGFLVYFCQEPSASRWNVASMERFVYKHEIIWNKKSPSGVFAKIMNIHEKIMIFIKGEGSVNKIEVLKDKHNIHDSKRELATIYEFARKYPQLTLSECMKKSRIYVSQTPVSDATYSHIKETIKPSYYALKPTKNVSSVMVFTAHNKLKRNLDSHNVKHPTVKPIQLVEILIRLTTSEQATILDPFIGSGTTALACMNTNRQYIGFELHKEYVDICNARIIENQKRLDYILI